jgi:hypothetical protein
LKTISRFAGVVVAATVAGVVAVDLAAPASAAFVSRATSIFPPDASDAPRASRAVSTLFLRAVSARGVARAVAVVVSRASRSRRASSSSSSSSSSSFSSPSSIARASRASARARADPSSSSSSRARAGASSSLSLTSNSVSDGASYLSRIEPSRDKTQSPRVAPSPRARRARARVTHVIARRRLRASSSSRAASRFGGRNDAIRRSKRRATE